MKSVCIIGAGPGGLVSAKALFNTGQFQVTIFEQKDRIGGIWALDQDSSDGFVSPYTPTNLSRFTVAFSELDWNSVEYDGVAEGLSKGATNTKAPMFPKFRMANRYLETYRQKYIPEDIMHLSREVLKAESTGSGWKVVTRQSDGNEDTAYFDYLIMASGFFARPRDLSQHQPKLAAALSSSPVRTIHSSQFRRLEDLFPKNVSPAGKKILMIGGANSSGEAAAAIALQLSDAQWSPDQSIAARYKDCKIIHVAPKPIYGVPPYVEYEEGSRTYVPVDFKLYDLLRRPKDQGSYAGRQSIEVRNLVHGFMQTMVGGDQSDISPALVSQEGPNRATVCVALAESYAEYVRSGLIEVIPGRVVDVDRCSADDISVIVDRHGDETIIYHITAVINATGYTPIPALDFLDEKTKAALDYDPTSMRLPTILEQWQTMNRAVPNLSLIGFYEGPYWPVMEAQARLTAHRWLSGGLAEQKSYETAEGLRALRQAMHERAIDVPQFWFGDYVGYLGDIAHELSLADNHGEFGPREGCISPARFVAPKMNQVEANSTMADLHQTWHECLAKGRYVPRATFRALHGDWKITRRIQSAIPTYPSGTLEGTASFHPRIPTRDKSGKHFDLEYLYIESGTLTLSNGHTMPISRRYVYRYSEADDQLSVWFVKPANQLEVDDLFHDLTFVKPEEAREAGACVARADHLCVEDMYYTEYRLPLIGTALRNFEVSHTVRGPDKDYVAVTKYERQPR